MKIEDSLQNTANSTTRKIDDQVRSERRSLFLVKLQAALLAHQAEDTANATANQVEGIKPDAETVAPLVSSMLPFGLNTKRCALCSAPITSGKYCDKCSSKLAAQAYGK